MINYIVIALSTYNTYNIIYLRYNLCRSCQSVKVIIILASYSDFRMVFESEDTT